MGPSPPPADNAAAAGRRPLSRNLPAGRLPGSRPRAPACAPLGAGSEDACPLPFLRAEFALPIPGNPSCLLSKSGHLGIGATVSYEWAGTVHELCGLGQGSTWVGEAFLPGCLLRRHRLRRSDLPATLHAGNRRAARSSRFLPLPLGSGPCRVRGNPATMDAWLPGPVVFGRRERC